MFRKYGLPLLALAGLVIALLVAFRGGKTIAPAAPVALPPEAPYRAFVSGSALVEASTENIAIGTQIAGIVSRIHVQVGSCVTTDDPLFTIDDRAQKAEVLVREAVVQTADAEFANTKYELQLAENLRGKSVNSQQDRETKMYAAQKAEAALAQTRAQLNAARVDLERLTVRAPVDGQVLQLKIHLGEFATTGVLQTPLLLLGNVDLLCLRVDVDENEAWRVRPGAQGVAYLRGNRQISTPLEFIRFEPYIVPKKSLTGDTAERVDTRVLQVIYSFKRNELPIYAGQQMDVYIDAPPHPAGELTTKASALR
jgi:RND family efflux transporter MFP subunit